MCPDKADGRASGIAACRFLSRIAYPNIFSLNTPPSQCGARSVPVQNVTLVTGLPCDCKFVCLTCACCLQVGLAHRCPPCAPVGRVGRGRVLQLAERAWWKYSVPANQTPHPPSHPLRTLKQKAHRMSHKKNLVFSIKTLSKR